MTGRDGLGTGTRGRGARARMCDGRYRASEGTRHGPAWVPSAHHRANWSDCKSCAAIVGNGTSKPGAYSRARLGPPGRSTPRSQISTQVGLDSRSGTFFDLIGHCGNGCTTTSGEMCPSKRAAFPGYVMVRVGSLALSCAKRPGSGCDLACVCVARVRFCRGASGPAERRRLASYSELCRKIEKGQLPISAQVRNQ